MLFRRPWNATVFQGFFLQRDSCGGKDANPLLRAQNNERLGSFLSAFPSISPFVGQFLELVLDDFPVSGSIVSFHACAPDKSQDPAKEKERQEPNDKENEGRNIVEGACYRCVEAGKHRTEDNDERKRDERDVQNRGDDTADDSAGAERKQTKRPPIFRVDIDRCRIVFHGEIDL